MASVNFDKSSGKYAGSGEGGEYQNYGVGNNERPFVEATRKGKFPSDNQGGGRSTGETPGVGTMYSVELNERPNISNPRNRGPERAPSRSASQGIPTVMMGSRATGRISGQD